MNPNETPQQPTPNPSEQPQPPITEPSPQQPAESTTTPEVSATPLAATPEATPVQPAAAVAPVTGSKALAIWSLVLSIVSLVTLILFFISGPLALIALILGIVALAKHKPGKGLSIAGIIISGLTLLALPFAMAITLTAYNAVQEKALENAQQAQ